MEHSIDHPDTPAPSIQFDSLDRGEVDLDSLSPVEQAAAKTALLVNGLLEKHGAELDEYGDGEVVLQRTEPSNLLKPDSVTVSRQQYDGVSAEIYSLRLKLPLSESAEISASLWYDTLPGLESEEEHIVSSVDLKDDTLSLTDITDEAERRAYIEAFSNGMDSLQELLETYESAPAS